VKHKKDPSVDLKGAESGVGKIFSQYNLRGSGRYRGDRRDLSLEGVVEGIEEGEGY
jgi:hypothetical protein